MKNKYYKLHKTEKFERRMEFVSWLVGTAILFYLLNLFKESIDITIAVIVFIAASLLHISILNENHLSTRRRELLEWIYNEL